MSSRHWFVRLLAFHGEIIENVIAKVKRFRAAVLNKHYWSARPYVKIGTLHWFLLRARIFQSKLLSAALFYRPISRRTRDAREAMQSAHALESLSSCVL